MQSIMLVLMLAAAPAPKVKLGLPDIQAVGIEPKMATFFGEHLATALKLEGVDVVTSREISSLLGLERQKALLGCGDEASNCMAELASALGADAVMLADLARLGEKTQVNLKIISARDGSTLSVFVDRVKGDEEIADSLARGAQQMSKEIRALLRPGVAIPVAVEAESPPARGASRFWWAPTAVGGALVVSGVAIFVLGKADYSQLTTDGSLSVGEAVALRDGGRTKQVAGVALLTSGLAIAAAGVALKLFAPSADTQVAIVPSSDGASLFVGGTFP